MGITSVLYALLGLVAVSTVSAFVPRIMLTRPNIKLSSSTEEAPFSDVSLIRIVAWGFFFSFLKEYIVVFWVFNPSSVTLSQKTYDDIRVVTQIIAKRAKGEEPMSRPQFEELKVAIEAIVNDAHDYYGGRPGGL